jgi:hypothetical protein
LHVEFGPTTLDQITYRGTSQRLRNCHYYRRNTTLCMSSLDHRPWIQEPTAGPVKGYATVTITGRIPHFACRVLTTDLGSKNLPRDQSKVTQLSLLLGNTTLCMSSLDHRPWIQEPTAGPIKGYATVTAGPVWADELSSLTLLYSQAAGQAVCRK